MSEQPQGQGWWVASDGRWYPPHLHPDARQLPPPPVAPPPSFAPPSYLPPSTSPARNGCLIAMAVVGGLVLLGFIFLGVVGAIFSDAVEDATTVGVPGTSAEVTLAEYDRIEEGMTLQDVEAVVGGKGALSSSAKSDEYVIETYSWAGAPIGSTATVTFTGGRVTNKAQYGLS